MKKQGHTLAEVLISIGVIGVLAALMLPMVNKYKPDEIKVKYIKTHDALMTAVRDLASNDAVYPAINIINSNDLVEYSAYPFLNTSDAILFGAKQRLIGGKGKLCRALGVTLNSISGNCDVDDTNYVSSYTEAAFSPTFTLANGIEFMVTTTMTNIDDDTTEAEYQTDIYIDVTGSKGDNCMWNKDSCTRPDRFKFIVGADGTFIIADPLGLYFRKTRGSWKLKELDPSKITGEIVTSLRTQDKKWVIKRRQPSQVVPE